MLQSRIIGHCPRNLSRTQRETQEAIEPPRVAITNPVDKSQCQLMAQLKMVINGYASPASVDGGNWTSAAK